MLLDFKMGRFIFSDFFCDGLTSNVVAFLVIYSYRSLFWRWWGKS